MWNLVTVAHKANALAHCPKIRPYVPSLYEMEQSRKTFNLKIIIENKFDKFSSGPVHSLDSVDRQSHFRVLW